MPGAERDGMAWPREERRESKSLGRFLKRRPIDLILVPGTCSACDDRDDLMGTVTAGWLSSESE